MFGFIKKVFIVLITSLVNASSMVNALQNSHTKCVSLRNQPNQHYARFNLFLLIYILMNTVKSYTIIYLLLN